MSTLEYERLLKTARQAALAAGEKIKAIRESGALDVRYKADKNLVTAADLAAEEIIIAALKKAAPDIPFMAEESSPDYQGANLIKGPLWVIDPVDGTTNYARGHNHVGVSIALALDGVVQLGVVFAPFQNELFEATRGKGALLNGLPIKPSAETRLASALVATGFPYSRQSLDVLTRRVLAVLRYCQDLRRLGAASLDLAWVACGRLEAYYETVMPWDMAAGSLIAREAGARVEQRFENKAENTLPADLNGLGLVATAPGIRDEFLALLAAADRDSGS